MKKQTLSSFIKRDANLRCLCNLSLSSKKSRGHIEDAFVRFLSIHRLGNNEIVAKIDITRGQSLDTVIFTRVILIICLKSLSEDFINIYISYNLDERCESRKIRITGDPKLIAQSASSPLTPLCSFAHFFIPVRHTAIIYYKHFS